MQQRQGRGNVVTAGSFFAFLSLVMVIAVSVTTFLFFPENARAATAFRNPVTATGSPDPWMTYFNGNYYLTYTTGGDIRIRKAASVQGLHGAPETVVWNNAGAPSARCCELWAAEFHRVNGPNGNRWYMYYTASNGADFGTHRMFVLESSGDDPMGPYTYKAQLDTGSVAAIDGTVFRNMYDNRLYFLWSQFPNLYIAEMSNPWTLTGPRLQIASPIYDWEKNGGPVNEGPEILQRFGKIHVIYSGSSCATPDYTLGRLTVPESADLLSASRWQNAKVPNPIFTRNDANGVYGTGHNGFFKSPNGTEDWMVYHGTSSTGGGCGSNRTARIQKITWNSDGTPNLGTPLSTSSTVALPAGDPGANPYVSLPTNQYRSLRATNPGFNSIYIRHRDGLGWIDQVTASASTVLKQDATFKIVPGLANASCYSFETRNYPGLYLRHYDFRLMISSDDGSSLLKQDATFCARSGLAGSGVSFESLNLPNYYIRHYDGKVYIAVNGGNNAWDNADYYGVDTTWSVDGAWSP